MQVNQPRLNWKTHLRLSRRSLCFTGTTDTCNRRNLEARTLAARLSWQPRLPRGGPVPRPPRYIDRGGYRPPPHTPNQITGARVPTSPVRPTLATLTQSTLYWRNSILILFTRFWLRLVCEVRDADGRWFVGCRPFASRCYDCMHPLCSLQAAILVVLSFAYFLLTFQPARFGFRSFLSQVQ